MTCRACGADIEPRHAGGVKPETAHRGSGAPVETGFLDFRSFPPPPVGSPTPWRR